jgi:protein tyrosine phosphatase (PTP) superfamily phosphohydrolase (DUF442 family)
VRHCDFIDAVALALRHQRKNAVLRLACLPLLIVASCSFNDDSPNNQFPDERGPKPRAEQSEPEPGKVEGSGLHNVYRITDKLYSGSSPDGEEGFRSLRKLGVQTIISVDGARPDVTTARKYGLRYVHLPFGYDGIPRQRVLELAKAVHVLPGPFYIHCHHGKHRGPAAAAAIHLCLDDKCSVNQVMAEMRRAGTDPHYTGLYAVPKSFKRPSPKDLDELPADFPEVAKVPDLAQFMVEIDARLENLKLIRAAAWKTPSKHPDLDPAHEALQLVEQFREAGRLEPVKKRPGEFRHWLAHAEAKAAELEQVLRLDKGSGAANLHAADEAFLKTGASCVHCHAKYRDMP